MYLLYRIGNHKQQYTYAKSSSMDPILGSEPDLVFVGLGVSFVSPLSLALWTISRTQCR